MNELPFMKHSWFVDVSILDSKIWNFKQQRGRQRLAAREFSSKIVRQDTVERLSVSPCNAVSVMVLYKAMLTRY